MTTESKERIRGQKPITGNGWLDLSAGGGIVGLVWLLLTATGLPENLTKPSEQRAVQVAVEQSDRRLTEAIESKVVPQIKDIANRMVTAQDIRRIVDEDSSWARARGVYDTRLSVVERVLIETEPRLRGIESSLTRIEEKVNRPVGNQNNRPMTDAEYKAWKAVQ